MLNSRLKPGGFVLHVLLSIAVGVMIGAGALVLARTKMTSLRYELSGLMKAESELSEQVDKLRVEVGTLSSPERVEPAAVELGMTYPEPGQVIDLPVPNTSFTREARAFEARP
ncbi:MAG: hypothetical protein GY725_23175 [bacterium]|nr:hypothetical protein [bacterium]